MSESSPGPLALERHRHPMPHDRTSALRVRMAGVLVGALAVLLPLLTPLPAEAAGFRLVFSDDFSGSRIDQSHWGVYNGGNGGDRIAAHTMVGNGMLTLRTQKVNGVWKGAGVSAARTNRQTYGRYEMRVRFDRGYGVRGVGLLWPATGWPPEVDFYEIPAASSERRVNTITNHFRVSGNHRMTHGSYAGDFTTWHVVALDWTPGRLVYRMDGVVQQVMTNRVPAQPMWMGIQTRPGSDLGVRPDSRTPAVVDMQVDWVRIYAYS